MEALRKNIDQFQKATEILTGLKPNISARDRKAAIDKLQISDMTICAYLNGNVRDLDTAAGLITFFRDRISQREKIFSESVVLE